MRETTLMKFQLSKWTLGTAVLTALAAAAAPADAGDWNNGDGSLKDARGRAAVAVPAPMPIADTGPGWYLRGGLGYSVKQTGDIISSGTDINAYRSFDELGGSPSLGFGFGAYVNNYIRWDLTGDLRPTQRASRNGVHHYNTTTVTPNTGTITVSRFIRDPITGAVIIDPVTLLPTREAFNAPTSGFHTFDVARSEEVRTGNQTFLANVYYEPLGWKVFKPYVGAGAGFAINSIKRTHSEFGDCTVAGVGTVTQWVDPFTDRPDTRREVACQATRTTFSNSGTSTQTGFGVAGALMAGVGYEVRDGLTLDLGYRYLWQASSVAAMSEAGTSGQVNKIELGDRVDHEVRTSLRWAIK
jgi:opacity protein-like surface antigen